MTADEFEKYYADNAGITVEQLRARGRVVRACYCGEDFCRGWISVVREIAEANDRDRPGWDSRLESDSL